MTLLCIGKEYQFSKIEKVVIDAYFQETIFIEEEAPKKVDAILQTLMEKGKRIAILLNSTKPPSFEIVNRLSLVILSKEFSQSIKIYTLDSFMEKIFSKYFLSEKNNLRIFEEIRPYSPYEYILKRGIDYTASILILILSSPIIVYSVYRIKKESKDGPIFFKQKRVGKNGKTFTCYKFRSMRPDAERDKPQFATKDDERAFPWGQFMRKTRIDEIPQIINIFRGEMHLVGPRPERPYWTKEFEKKIPEYRERHTVAPGITGWAQVNYPYGANLYDAKQKLMYDLFYIKNWNLLLEIKTIMKTLKIIMKKSGI